MKTLINNAQVWKLNKLECEIRKMNLHILVGSVLKVNCSITVLAYIIHLTDQDLRWLNSASLELRVLYSICVSRE